MSILSAIVSKVELKSYEVIQLFKIEENLFYKSFIYILVIKNAILTFG